MLDLLAGFVTELRNAGLPVSLTENLDAMEAVQYIPIEDREAFKYALGATLVKNNSHWRAFETVFEVYFSLRGPEYKLKDADESHFDEMWREMQEQMRQGEGRGAAGGSMREISRSVVEISDLNIQIATAVEQQNQVTQELNRNLESINGNSEKVAASARRAGEAGQHLEALTERLRELVGRFRLS